MTSHRSSAAAMTSRKHRVRRLLTSDRSVLLVNATLYEAGWFGVVLGVAAGQALLGSAIGIAAIAAHLLVVQERRVEMQRIAAAVAIGVVVETINAWLGVYEAETGLPTAGPFAPWLLVIWAGFATTFYRSLRWLSGRPGLAVPIGAIAGPLAFWAGERLGAISMTREPLLLGALAVQWAIALPLLVWISDRLAMRRPVATRVAAAATVAVVIVAFAPGSALAASKANEVDFASNCAAASSSELGIRGQASYEYLGFIDVFDAALYDESQRRGEPVLSPVPKCLVIRYKRDFAAEDFADVTVRGIKENIRSEELTRLMPRIERFNRLYRDVKKGDRYSLRFVPGKGTVLSYNGRPRGIIEGDDFAAALFSIWLGRNSMDDELRRRLLGGT